MFREMRKKEQQLTEEEAKKILQEGDMGVLGLIGDGAYPYTVPVNYLYAEGKIYIHTATEGHKIDALQHNPKLSFVVVAQKDVIPEDLTTHYRSVIVFGRGSIIREEKEKKRIICLFSRKYSDDEAYIEKTADRLLSHFVCIAVEIEHMTGKGKQDG